MMQFSDYIIYVDESGDHGLTRINPEFPAFALSFCIIRKDVYVNEIVPALQQLKFDFWGHDRIIFHEHEIRKEQNDFAFLRTNATLRQRFYEKLNGIMKDAETTIIASVIMKEKFKERPDKQNNPYHFAFSMCMDKTLEFLLSVGQQEKLVHIIAESRAERENNELKLAFLDFLNHRNQHNFGKIDFDIKFASKQINSTGLQLADLIARPIALKILRPEQENRAFEIIKTKFPATGGMNVFSE